MTSPYEGLPPRAFWRTGVAEQCAENIPDLYRRKFEIPRSARIATAGSCFAQHIAAHLRARKFTVLDVEPAPPHLTPAVAPKFGYGLYSARYANIYTARQLRQIVEEARGEFAPFDPVWQKDGRYYDAQRPSVEPEGLSSAEEVLAHRKAHLRRVVELLKSADVFIFTLGLTEAWTHAETGTAYPTAPGTIAGSYDPRMHRFRNFGFQEIYDDLKRFVELALEANPSMRFLLTVSPVPLVATASGEHVLAATIYSKSVLRAVAGQLFQEQDNIDYFPSYEIITSALSKGSFFENNLRSVRPGGVSAAMNAFFAEHDEAPQTRTASKPPAKARKTADIVCEDLLLEAFEPPSSMRLYASPDNVRHSLCAIGDSHLAAVKLAWDRIGQSDTRLTFFAAPGKGTDLLRVRDGTLVIADRRASRAMKRTSGLDSIRGDYDGYLVHGLGLGVNFALSTLRIFRKQDAKRPLADIIADPEFCSQLESSICASRAVVALAKLRQISERPVLFSPLPLSMATECFLREKLREAGQGPALTAAFHAAVTRALETLKTTFLPQPADTLADDGVATAEKFSLAPERFGQANASADAAHMNAEYGEAVLRAFLRSGLTAKGT